jgi:L-ribulose-5-phosphate 4-epimerase
MASHGHPEGVIQYGLFHQDAAAVSDEWVAMLESVRAPLFARGVIGCDPLRYDGLGYGNVSMRCVDGFVITGTQTGHLETLQAEHYVLVSGWNFASFSLWSRGPIRPSSEAMTHAMIYDALPSVGAVLHVHSPEAWQRSRKIRVAETPTDAGYGSPAMVSAIACLVEREHWQERGVFVMAGHEDGIVAFGTDLEDASELMMSTLNA